MNASFPHHYRTSLVRTAPSRATIAAAPRMPIAGAPPPEFGGVDTAWSPEHLLLAAAGLCLEMTFEALAARRSLAVHAWRAQMEGVLDRTSSGPGFTSLVARIEIVVDRAEIERARQLLDDAKRHCIVSNSLRIPVSLEATVSAEVG